MAKTKVVPARRIRGEYVPPGDKSISHRLAILGSLAHGVTRIHHYCPGEDFRSTLQCLKTLCVPIRVSRDTVEIYGQGLYTYRDTGDVLDAGNSGTTIRLLAGVMAGQPFTSCLTGDDSLRNRPMRRVIYPLSLMGAQVEARKGNYPPLIIRGGPLRPIRYVLPVASAQVKSAILLAGLFARGVTEVVEPVPSRNHTEHLLQAYGARIDVADGVIRVEGGHPLRAFGDYVVPGDISSAAYFIVAAVLLPGSDLVVRNVNLNETRTGILDVIQRMGGRIEVLERRRVRGEWVGDIRVRHSPLRGTRIGRDMIGRVIDELPLVALLGSQAEGVTVVRNARELRVKETDRIAAIVQNCRALGMAIEEKPDGFIVEGPQRIRGGTVQSFGDHRMVMTFSVAGLLSQEGVEIENSEVVGISYPSFFEDLHRLVEPA
jgi:3-phosphoshikimate 1-carboxyvinyltransferase